nr:LacI family DNA-binding transcriptional regulator [Oscillochloris sp. ZM17-4]
MSTLRLRKVTIKDIARICKVSTQTVSRVLNKRPDVAPATREAVEKAIAELGYQPSALARSLVQQQSFTLGVIVAGLKYLGVSQTLNGIAEQCEASGYALLLKELPFFDVTDIVPIIEALIAHQVEGIIFAAPELNDNVRMVQAQLPASCPPILFVKSRPHARYTTVSIDNYQGACTAVEYLARLGRRRVACISGPMEWLESRQRWQAWADVMGRVGSPCSEAQWCAGNWSSASGEAAFERLMRTYPEMDAVFASNDQMALGVLHYAYTHGIRVPDDLAVVGFDDLSDSAQFSPALTTVRQPLRELGILAVKTLLSQVEGDATPSASTMITLQPELVIRDSTPCAPGA